MPYQDPYLVTLSLGAFLPPSLAEHPHKTHILAHLETGKKKTRNIRTQGRPRPHDGSPASPADMAFTGRRFRLHDEPGKRALDDDLETSRAAAYAANERGGCTELTD